jgi:hypothetical protein
MAIKLSDGLPCATFFASGRIFFGICALFMQLSIIFWPQAVAWARRSQEANGVDKILAELAEAHRVPTDPYAAPAKKFRQLV